MTPLVSILIPAYNSEKWIGETLNSALEQTWPRLEVIVVDDGSRDQTLSIAKSFESKNLKVYAQENAGAPLARNKAYSLSQGDYLVWLDADDLMSRDKITNQIKSLQQRGTEDSVGSCNWGNFYYRTSNAKFLETSLCQDLKPASWLRYKMSENLHMQTATWLVSRRITEKAGLWDPSLISDDDGEYFCRILLSSDKIVYEPNAFVYYRATNSGSWGTLGKSDRKLEAQWKSMKLHVEYLLSLENSERTRKASVFYLNTWSHHFEWYRIDLLEEIKAKAIELGGEIVEKKLPWKWRWIDLLLGKQFARETVSLMREIKSKSKQEWDRAMYRLSI